MKLPWPDLSSWSIPRTAWIQVEVTTRCNAACIYCPRTAYRDAWHDRSLSPATFRRLLPALKKTRLVHLQGWGEPFLHPDFFTLTALAKEAGCRVSTTTNGMLLNAEKLRQVVESGLDLIAFSLTGLEELNDRARPGTSFRQVLAAIQTLNRLKAAAGSATPQIHIAYLLLKSGLPDLEKLPQFLEGLGVQQAVISTLDFVPTRELAGESFTAGDPAAHEELQARLAAMTARGGQRRGAGPLPPEVPRRQGLALSRKSPAGALRGGGRRRLPLCLHQPAGIPGDLRGARRGTALPTPGLREPPGPGFGGHLATAGLCPLPSHVFHRSPGHPLPPLLEALKPSCAQTRLFSRSHFKTWFPFYPER